MNRRRASLLLCGVVLVSVSTLAGLDEVVEKRTLRETTSLAPSQDLIVDNLHGDISVTGHSGSEIRMVAVETVRARDQERLERARREVSLAIRETSEGLVVCADGPFRETGDCTEWADNQWRNPGYEVTYEIELQVPRELSSLRVRTVDGDIDISDVRGDFNIGGVNGGIEMSGVDGSGKWGRALRLRVRGSASPADDPGNTPRQDDLPHRAHYGDTHRGGRSTIHLREHQRRHPGSPCALTTESAGGNGSATARGHL
jgi:hypothetical protein